MSIVVREFIKSFQKKFTKYWPDLDNVAICGPFRVTLKKSEVHSNFVSRVFHLAHINFKEIRQVSGSLTNVLISTVNLIFNVRYTNTITQRGPIMECPPIPKRSSHCSSIC